MILHELEQYWTINSKLSLLLHIMYYFPNSLKWNHNSVDMHWPFDLMMLLSHSTSCRGGMRRESGKLGLPLNWYTAMPPTILLSSDHPRRPTELTHQSRGISYLPCKPASLQSAGSSAYLQPLTCCWQLFYGFYSSRLVKWEQRHNTLPHKLP